ncbi:MAG: glycosyltransferase [Candidatus Portnoybacteria bacterium]|jgi:glycosyltransferase involved in cell wall biosynthesis|nr:glycosyltransferase [Candidatus Portnoybacteria bacterium]
MKVAIIHDYLVRLGGAERALLALSEIWPEAPIYTLLYDSQAVGRCFSPERVRTSFLQKFPGFLRRRYRWLLPLLPSAAESFDLRDFDLVISSSSAFAKGIILRPKTTHICYCHNTARFLWDYYWPYLNEQKLGGFIKLLAKIYLSYLRLWDRAAASRVDYFLANSQATAARIKKYYGRPAKVIYPPARLPESRRISETDKDSPDGYFLIVSQLVPYKKIDVAVEAFNKLGWPLVIIGDGPQKKDLLEIAKPNVKILGWQSDGVVAEYLKNCLAFVFPGEDDFGLAPVEAMGWGKPVLALNEGGAKEIVLPGLNGEFFVSPVPEILADGARRLRENLANYSPLVIRKWAEKFSEERFKREIMDFVKRLSYN